MFTCHQYLSDDDFKYYSVKYAKEIKQGNGDCLIRELMMASRYKEVTDIVSTPDIRKLFHLICLYPVGSNAKDVMTEPASLIYMKDRLNTSRMTSEDSLIFDTGSMLRFMNVYKPQNTVLKILPFHSTHLLEKLRYSNRVIEETFPP
jgi:hypothetical protein